ncbi:MAG: lipase secretion chaperone [Arenimonas sp.]
MSRKSPFILGVAVLGIATLGLFFYAKNDSSRNLAGESTKNQADAAAQSASNSGDSIATANKKEFSLETSSLRSTEIDGGILLDANGQVLIDIGMRRLFDYYLSLVGERDIVQIRQLLKDQLLTQYSPASTETALQYFDRYTDYLNALSALNIGGLANPEERLERVSALRKKMLGEQMALAFFAEEEALAALTLKRMAIANDKTLSADEKSRLLAELDSSAGYSARTEADTAALIMEQNRQLDALKLSDAQRAAEREALWGKEAAGRLAQLDQQRAQWDARIEQYLLARSRIDANRGLSAAARSQAIAALRARQFNEVEQRRIASLEAIGQLKPGG